MTTPDRAITQRPTSTSLLTIDSEDRFASYIDKRAAPLTPYALNESPYNFRITKGQAIMNGFLTRIAVTEVVFPWVLPNINEKTSKILFDYQVGGGPVVPAQLITLPVGFYKPVDIAQAIQAAVNTIAGAGFLAVSYGENGTPIFKFDVSGGVIDFDPMPYNSASYPYPATTKQLYDILGLFSTSILAPTIYGLPTFCQAIRYVDIVSPQLVANQGLSDATSQTIGRDALCRIYIGDAGETVADAEDPLFCPPGCRSATIYRQFATPKYVQWNAQMPVGSSVQFQVYDDTGVLLSVGPIAGGILDTAIYADWSMTLLVTEN